MATIKDVARVAEVSTSTVSRVLNGGSVSADVIRRVNLAVKDLGYKVNTSARGLVQRYANIAGVIAADISNPPITSMFHGISERMRERGITVLLGNSESDTEKELELFRMFARERARGVIYTGREINEQILQAINDFPGNVIVAAQEYPGLMCPVVVFDNYKAFKELTTAVISGGHTDIVMIAGPDQDIQAGSERVRGFTDALKDAGLPFNSSRTINAGFTLEEGEKAMKTLLDRLKRLPQAVLCASDLIAIGAMRQLHHAGVSIPGQVSVLGFDNIPVGEKLIPSLSTVELDFFELGEVCADLLYNSFSRKRSHVRKVIFDHKVIFRESFAPVHKSERSV